MKPQTLRLAGILLIILPTVIYGGVSILYFLINDPQYAQNELRQDLWRAGHAHAGVLLILSLLCLVFVDHANLSALLKKTATVLITSSAILLPAGFFFSITDPSATEPNGLIVLNYIGAILLAVGLVILGIGLIRKKND
jgi:hypothetical protein